MAELPFGRGDHPSAVVAARHIGGCEHGAAACGSHGVNGFLSALLVAVDDHDSRALSREEQCRFPPDAAAGAGDERHFSVQSSGHVVKSVRNTGAAPNR